MKRCQHPALFFLRAIAILNLVHTLPHSATAATTRNWIGGSRFWNNNGNWSSFGVPRLDYGSESSSAADDADLHRYMKFKHCI